MPAPEEAAADGEGMDVVKTNIEEIGASVELKSGPWRRLQHRDPADARHQLRADRGVDREATRPGACQRGRASPGYPHSGRSGPGDRADQPHAHAAPA